MLKLRVIKFVSKLKAITIAGQELKSKIKALSWLKQLQKSLERI